MNFSSPGITIKYVAYNMAYMTCQCRSAHLVAVDWPLARIFPQLLRRTMSFQNLPELLIILSFVHLQQLRDLLNNITTEWNDVSELRQNEVSNKFPPSGRVGFSGHGTSVLGIRALEIKFSRNSILCTVYLILYSL